MTMINFKLLLICLKNNKNERNYLLHWTSKQLGILIRILSCEALRSLHIFAKLSSEIY